MGKVISIRTGSAAIRPTPPTRCIVVGRVGKVYRVSVLWDRDAGDGPLGGDFPDYDAALEYASSLKMEKGWSICSFPEAE